VDVDAAVVVVSCGAVVPGAAVVVVVLSESPHAAVITMATTTSATNLLDTLLDTPRLRSPIPFLARMAPPGASWRSPRPETLPQAYLACRYAVSQCGRDGALPEMMPQGTRGGRDHPREAIARIPAY
jgi:hypothetical protein